MIRHSASPAFHETVEAQPISNGMRRNVTWNEKGMLVIFRSERRERADTENVKV